MIPNEIHNAFYAGVRTNRFPLSANDAVTVRKGRKPGEKAAVISIQSVDPAPAYLVEYGDGSDDIVLLEDLKSERAFRRHVPGARP